MATELKVTGRLLTASADTRRLNPHLFGGGVKTLHVEFPKVLAPNKPAKRIRQDGKPLMNGLELAALAWLKLKHPQTLFHCQAWRVKIANGGWFKADICAIVGGQWTAWECKEFKGKNVDRGILALKAAAHQFPEVRWVLLSKNQGRFCEQVILP